MCVCVCVINLDVICVILLYYLCSPIILYKYRKRVLEQRLSPLTTQVEDLRRVRERGNGRKGAGGARGGGEASE